MKEVILNAPNYCQRFALEVIRQEGASEPLFEISRCLELGWVGVDQLVEDEWERGQAVD